MRERGHDVETQYLSGRWQRRNDRDGGLGQLELVGREFRHLSQVPQEVAERDKQGFSGPDASWFKGQSIDFVRSILFDDQAEIYRYLDPKPLRALIGDHLDGREQTIDVVRAFDQHLQFGTHPPLGATDTFCANALLSL